MTVSDYETLDDSSQQDVVTEPDPKPESVKVSGQAWGRLLKLFHLPLPAILIVITEFFEKWTYFGIRAILVLYFTNVLDLSQSRATSLYHVFILLSTPITILGAVLSDFCCGRYRTILIMSVIYLIGAIVLSLSAIPGHRGWEAADSYIGLFLISVGSGGIRSSMSPFGADQIDEKGDKRFRVYFVFFYFAMNLAALIAGIITPILREDIQCFGSGCYSLAFGIPSAMLLLGLVIFVLGTSRYKIYPPTGSLFSKVFLATGSAIKNKAKWCLSKEKEGTKQHWLDWADQQYQHEIIGEIKQLYRVLALYPLLPMYWALYEQQGSRWTLQAQAMDRNVGIMRIKPDQMQSLNFMLVLLLLPLFEGVIYPFFEKKKLLIGPIPRMAIGMVGLVISFIVAGIVQIQIQQRQMPQLSSDMTELTVFNGVSCQLMVISPKRNILINPQTFSSRPFVDRVPFTIEVIPMNCSVLLPLNLTIDTTTTGSYQTLFVVQDFKTKQLAVKQISDNIVSLLDNTALVRVVSALEQLHPNWSVELEQQLFLLCIPIKMGACLSMNLDSSIFPALQDATLNSTFILQLRTESEAVQPLLLKPLTPSTYTPLVTGRYSVELSGAGLGSFNVTGEIDLKDGGVYTIIFYQADHTGNVSMHINTDVHPRTVSVLWQIPQYLLISMSEILFAVPGLHLAYTQAPSSMRSVVMAAWILTNGLGNLIVVLVAELTPINNQAVEFFLFAALLGLFTFIFSATGTFYKYQPVDAAPLTSNRKESEADGLKSGMKMSPSYTSEDQINQRVDQ